MAQKCSIKAKQDIGMTHHDFLMELLIIVMLYLGTVMNNRYCDDSRVLDQIEYPDKTQSTMNTIGHCNGQQNTMMNELITDDATDPQGKVMA